VSLFLDGVGGGIGHFHPPNHRVLPLLFPGTGPEMATKWDANVLIIPTYLANGVRVRMSKNVDEWGKDSEHTFGKFDDSNPYKIWYLREGTEVKFHLEVEDEKAEREGLAVVLMIAVLCNEEHEVADGQDNGAQTEDE